PSTDARFPREKRASIESKDYVWRIGSRRTSAKALLRRAGFLKELPQGLLALEAHHHVDDVVAAHRHDHRDGTRVERLRKLRLLVDVDLADLDLAFELASELVDHRAERAAGTTPGRPQVHDHGH